MPTTITLTAEILTANQIDPDLNDNAVSVVLSVDEDPTPAKVASLKLIPPLMAQVVLAPGQNVVIPWAVKNLGPDPASGIVILAPLPSSVTYIDHETTSGEWSSGLWVINDIAVGATERLDFMVKV